MEGTPAPFRIRRLLLVELVPALVGAVFLALLLLAAAGEPAGQPSRGPAGEATGGPAGGQARDWLDPARLPDRPPHELAAMVVVLVTAVLVALWLRSLFERLLHGRLPGWADARVFRAIRPTRLPAVLASSRNAIDRLYGFDLALAWPRLDPLLSDRMRGLVDQRRTAFELASRGTATAATVTLAAVAASLVWPRSALLLVPAPMVVTWFTYQAAVRTAAGYGQAVRVAFDLHRFDLLAALHLRLPDSPAEERAFNRSLSASWATDVPVELAYRHRGIDTDVLDRVEDAVKDVLVPPTPVTFRGVVEVTLQGAEPIGDRGERQWRVPVGQRSRLQVALVVGLDAMTPPGRGPLEDWENPSAMATEFLDVRGRSAPRVEVEIDIDAPFIDVAEPHHSLDLASDEDLGVRSTDIMVPRPGRYDLLVTLFSSGRLVQAVPIELQAVA
ncbi:MAG TPA: hypothetical protein VFM54_24070 [Micromonosporaceae bacterium]|nr:hypothetical protein [Micromonosporaceae bacterium]